MIWEEDDDYVNNYKIKNTVKFLKEQIKDIEVIAEKKATELYLNKNKLNQFNKDLKRKEEELECYNIMFPNYEYLKQFREELTIYDEVEELKEDIKNLQGNISILNKTLELQKSNLDTEIQKIVRLNVDLNWIKKD